MPLCSLAACLLIAAGCGTSTPPKADTGPAPSPELARAEQLYSQGRHADAITECIDLARRDPLMPGLPALQKKIMTRLTAQRRRAMEPKVAATHERMSIDADQRKTVPEVYGIRKTFTPTNVVHQTPRTTMEEVLDKPVTVHLDNVGLDEFILAIGASDDINIIADAMATDATMTLHADQVPLSEILDYVARNLGLSFSIGESIIWATTQEEATETGIPMETRLYRLRRGLANSEIGQGEGAVAAAEINLVETIMRFVPQPDGADILFDSKVHLLIVKNHKHNLALVEELVEALDVTPPQILIEARFISTSINDLRELGIDWVLDSDLGVTSETGIRNGRLTDIDNTLIEKGARIGFAPFANEAQGANFTYRGVLTDPMFQAVLHALETSGKARTLSVPKVTTINNRQAKIRVGEDFRYFEQYDIQSVPGTSGGGGTYGGSTTYASMIVPSGTPTLEELGIELEVTPSVGSDRKAIMLKLVPEISSFKEWIEYEVANFGNSGGQNYNNNNNNNNNTQTATNNTSLLKLPIFTRSTIETEVVVQSGETVVMGGLITSTENQIDSSVPFLSSIPIIGRLFRHKNVEETKDNLLIFVTATLLSERGENLIPLEKPTAEGEGG